MPGNLAAVFKECVVLQEVVEARIRFAKTS